MKWFNLFVFRKLFSVRYLLIFTIRINTYREAPFSLSLSRMQLIDLFLSSFMNTEQRKRLKRNSIHLINLTIHHMTNSVLFCFVQIFVAKGTAMPITKIRNEIFMYDFCEMFGFSCYFFWSICNKYKVFVYDVLTASLFFWRNQLSCLRAYLSMKARCILTHTTWNDRNKICWKDILRGNNL